MSLSTALSWGLPVGVIVAIAYSVLVQDVDLGFA